MLAEQVARATVSSHLYVLSEVQCRPPLRRVSSDFGSFANGVCHVMEITIAESNPNMELLALAFYLSRPTPRLPG